MANHLYRTVPATRLRAEQSRFLLPAETRTCSASTRTPRTAPGPTQWITRAQLPTVTWSGRPGLLSPPSCVKIRMTGDVPLHPLYAPWPSQGQTFTSCIGRKHETKKQDGMRVRSDRKEIREAEREKMTKGPVTKLMEDTVALRQFFLPILRSSPVSIIQPLLHTHSFTYTLFFQDKLEKLGSLPKSTTLLDFQQYRVYVRGSSATRGEPLGRTISCRLGSCSLVFIYLSTVFASLYSLSLTARQIIVQSPCITYLILKHLLYHLSRT